MGADLTVERPGFRLDLQLRVGTGEVVALLGPNGAGKTTALRALAGLQPLDAGHLCVDGELLEDAAAGLRVPTQDRQIGLVFQDYLLFPHLSALDNVAFGPRARGARKAAARASARAWLERVGLTDQLSARPGALSGGQAQRVALARALAGSPRLLLLDEPLSALDASTRLEVRSDLRHHLESYDGVTVLVSHDALDAMVLSDRVLVLEEGRITQQGRPEEIARAPRTEYVARLVGLNLYRGSADGEAVRLDGGGVLRLARPLHGSVHVAFPPSAVSLFPSEPHGSPRNRWPVTVRAIEQHGAIIRVRLDGTPPVLADVTAGAVAELELTPGLMLWAALKASETRGYPA